MKALQRSLVRGQSLALLTDLYQLTMVYGYWKAKIHERKAVFHLHFRRRPFQGGFAIAAGLQTAIEFLREFQFAADDLSYLETLQDTRGKRLFEPAFFDFLSKFSFQCDVDALEEGTAVFPNIPILRVKGPIWQAQLLESPMLNLINFQTLIATKAARICLAASPDPVIEFGMRRAQGIDGAISASRAAFIGGCVATSDVIAGKLFDIPVKGTHAHSWVMAFDEEEESFIAFGRAMPGNCILLIDTYNSINGVKKAIHAAKKLKGEGFELEGVRLDSGNLAELSIKIRKILDEEGFLKARIMASNELDEKLISELKKKGAKITIWGVGTHLVTGREQPALDGIYKLSAVQNGKGEWVDKLKTSDQRAKTTHPGILQVRRFIDEGKYVGDVIFDERTKLGSSCMAFHCIDPDQKREFKGKSRDLLIPVFKEGKEVYRSPTLEKIQERTKKELSSLSPSILSLFDPEDYFVGLESKLHEKKRLMIEALEKA